MNYHLHYNRLIRRAKEREITTYTESHHIIPRCIGGTDEKENLVRLTGREHFIAHLLLSKMYPEENGLILAIHMMTVNSNSRSKERINNRMYSWLKEKHSKAMSKIQLGEGNSQFGTYWISNVNEEVSKKIHKSEMMPDGWVKGRNVWNRLKQIQKNKNKKEILDKEKKIKYEVVKETKERLAKEKKIKNEMIEQETIFYFKKYIESDYVSLNEFSKNEVDFSLVTLTKRFQKYITEYSSVSKQGGQKLKEKLKSIASQM